MLLRHKNVIRAEPGVRKRRPPHAESARRRRLALLVDTGVIIAGGADFPVESPNPSHGIYAAVAASHGRAAGWRLGQRMTREEAVRFFPTWNVFASHREADVGALIR